MTQEGHPNRHGAGRYLFWGVASALLAAFIAWSFVPAAVPVDLGTVERGAMTVRVEGEGRTRVRDVYAVSAPAAGVLLRIEAQPGDPVKAGQTLLAIIEPADPTILDQRSRAEGAATVQAAEDALTLAESEVDRAKAERAFAQSELIRAVQLRRNGTVSQRALDMAELEVATREAAVKSGEATVKVRQHELENARARLITPTSRNGNDGDCCVALTAPVDGQVLRVMIKSEGLVQAGATLMEVGDPGALEVVVDLLTSDAARLTEGADVVISNWGGEDLQGRVRLIEPSGYTKVSVLGIEEQRVDVIVDITSPVPKALGHGFRVEVGVLEWAAADVLKAPMSALFRAGDGWAVIVMGDGHARLNKVQVGHMNGQFGEVLAGLNAGDQVVLHPSDRVTDGARVTPRAQ